MAMRRNLRQAVQQLRQGYCQLPRTYRTETAASGLIDSGACGRVSWEGPSLAGVSHSELSSTLVGNCTDQLSIPTQRSTRSQWLPRSLHSRCLTKTMLDYNRVVSALHLPSSGQQPRLFSIGPAAEPQPATYTVTVVTGDVRGAGSPMSAVIQLVGSQGVSEHIRVGDDADNPGFKRGSRTEVTVDVAEELGELQRVVVHQEEPNEWEGGVGWFLDYVEVAGPGNELRTFPCSNWLGHSAADGQFSGERERNLIPPHADVANVTEYLAEPLQVTTAATVVPHPDKVTPRTKAVLHQGFGHGGEDAYYIAWGPRNGMLGLGVSDGVYMWRDQGIDAGVFSRSLMLSAKNAIEYGQTDVWNVMMDAAATVEENCIKGSATCCLVVVDTLQGRLTSANIGDSGYVIIGSSPRNDKPHIKFRTPQQEHTFGYPYQLGHQDMADKAEHAMLAHIPLVPDDVLVMGSDGLWDNVSEDEILHIVLEEKNSPSTPRPMNIAQKLTKAAFYNSHDKGKVTPYSLGATEAFEMVFNGGKQDDIAVVVALFSGDVIPRRVENLGRHGLGKE